MLAFLIALLAVGVADSTEYYYVRNDVRALEAWCRQDRTELEDLHCRYRIYPLTRDSRLLKDLPDEPATATPRSLALLSGLWGYRASESGFPAVIGRGRRAQHLLDRAVALDPDDPFVLLVEGQSLLFKPRIAGGSRTEAIERFRQLIGVLEGMEDPPLLPEEARTWHWFALARDGDPAADALRQTLLDAHPLPLFREMLENPPS